jgi:copper/silver efflux system protein
LFSKITGFCVKKPNRILAVFALGAILGLVSLALSPFDAIPDLSDPQILLYARVDGSAEEVTQKATQPVMELLKNLPEVAAVRGFSDLGYSYVTVVLKENRDSVETRRKIESLIRDSSTSAPVTWQVSHDVSGVGWVFQYSLSNTYGLDLYQLRALQEQVIGPALSRLDGVAEVAPVGGYIKRYVMEVNPLLFQELRLNPADLARALEDQAKELRGCMVMLGERDVILPYSGPAPRGPGKITILPHTPPGTPADLAALKLKIGSRVFLLGQLANVRQYPQTQRGMADLNGEQEVVGGVVVARKGVNTLALIGRIKSRIAELQGTLPKGINIQPVYDRGQLIYGSMSTVGLELLQELLLLALLVILFLRHYPSLLVLGCAFIGALLLVFLPLRLAGLSINLMTLGGLAIAIGDMLDAGIILVENANRRLSEKGKSLKEAARRKELIASCSMLFKPLFFTLLIVVVSFLPVFALNGQAGRLLGPLAASKTLSMICALCVTFFLIPALGARFLKGPFMREEDNKFSMRIRAFYKPSLEWVLKKPIGSLGMNLLLLIATIPLFWGLPRQFLPSLNEESLLYMPLTMAGVPPEQLAHMLREMDKRIKSFPEVARVFGKAGSCESATDPAPLYMIESTIILKPRSQWPQGMTQTRLVSEMNAVLQFMGVSNGWTQPIRGRIDMQATGIRTPLGLKVKASTLEQAETAAIFLEKVLLQTPGVKWATAERVTKAPSLSVAVDKAAAAKAGLTPDEVLGQLLAYAGGASLGKAGFLGVPVGIVYPGGFIENFNDLNRFPVFTRQGKTIPLSRLARLELGEGPDMIPLENGKPAIYVYLDVDAKDKVKWVEQTKPKLAEALSKESGVDFEFSGQYEAEQKTRDRLKWLVPLCVLLIAILLAFAFASLREAFLIMLSVPYALIGGVWIQTLLGIPLSVSTWVGYIALFAVAVQTGVVMVVYLKEALSRRADGRGLNDAVLRKAVLEGSVLRLRPKLMTVATNVIGFLPLLWTKGPGDDLLASIAAPIVGGMITSAIHVLYITPILFYLMNRGLVKKK